MQKKHKPILSICIPTYNRASILDSCLSSIFTQLNKDMDIEIIVSNNKSTDSTNDIIRKFAGHPKFTCFEQAENLGAVKNILKLVAEYANGEFCWIIGDDDFLLQGALKAMIDLVTQRAQQTDYFYASVKGINIDDYNAYPRHFDTVLYADRIHTGQLQYEELGSFEEVISPDYSIIFLGELMASVFRREIWVQYPINGEGEYLETLETTYPHSVVLANTFFGKRAVYIKTPLLVCLDGAREWWDKLGYILIEQVKNLLDLYEAKGLSKQILKKCHKTYIIMTFKPFMKFLFKPNSDYRDKINFRRYFIFLIKNPLLLISHLKNIVVARSRGFIKKGG